jgi:hypothetical protein
MISALYVQTGGAYWNLPGVDPWDEARDARAGELAFKGGGVNSTARIHTPTAFREILIGMARSATQ